MSSEWTWNRLGDYCLKVGSGSTPTGGKDAYLDHGPFMLIRSQNIYNDGFKPAGLAFISNEQAKKLDGVSVEAGDVLLNITGDSVARVCLALSQYLPARVNQHVAIIRPKSSVFDSRFVRYFLASAYQQDLMLGMAAAGATRNALTKSMIEDFKVPCPPIGVQRGVADVLASLDDRITLLRETNATLETIAKALFKSWFVDFDPVRAKMEGRAPEGMDEAAASLFPDGFEESELGLVPRGWKTAVLAELTTKIGSGATPRGGKDVYLDDGVALIRSQNIYDSEFVWGGLARISNDAADQLKSVEVKPTDVLLNITGASILRTCAVIPDVLPARVNQHVAIIRAKESIPSRYIHLHLLQRKTKEFLLGLNAGGSREAVTKAHIESVPIILPSDAVLNVFKAITNPIYLRNEEFSRQERTLATLRDTLLPRLISGQLRLPEVQQQLADVAA